MANRIDFLQRKVFCIVHDPSCSAALAVMGCPRYSGCSHGPFSLEDLKGVLSQRPFHGITTLRLETRHIFRVLRRSFGVGTAIGECTFAMLPGLQTLVLGCPSRNHHENLAELLSYVSPHLSKLELRRPPYSVLSVFRKIGEFRELSSLVLDGCYTRWYVSNRLRDGANCMKVLAESLKDLPLLQELSIRKMKVCGITPEGYSCIFSPVLSVLGNKTTLVSLEFKQVELETTCGAVAVKYPLNPKQLCDAQFWPRVNQAMAKCKNPDKSEDWGHAVVMVSDRLDCLHYVLSKLPTHHIHGTAFIENMERVRRIPFAHPFLLHRSGLGCCNNVGINSTEGPMGFD